MIATNDNESFSVLVDEKNIGVWVVFMCGPECSPYDGRWWTLILQFPNEYPSNGPVIRFSKVPYHVSISEQGRIVLPEVQDYYTESLHIFEILEEIRILLMRADAREAVDNDRLDTYRDQARYAAKIREYNEKNSKASLDDCLKGLNIKEADLPEEDQRDVIIPRQFLCPITGRLMKEPVLSPTTGLCYEKTALEQLLRLNPRARCPVTGKLFQKEDRNLQPALRMKQLINEYKRRNG